MKLVICILIFGGWTRWPTELLSNPEHSVILCDCLSDSWKAIFLAESKLLQSYCQCTLFQNNQKVWFASAHCFPQPMSIFRDCVYKRIQFQSPQWDNRCLNHSLEEDRKSSRLSMFTFQWQGSSNLSLRGDSVGWDYKSKGNWSLKHQGFRLDKCNMMQSRLSAVFFFLLGLSFCLTIPIPLEDSHEFTEKDLQFVEVRYKMINLHVLYIVSLVVTTVWKLGLLLLFPFLALSQDSLWSPSESCWHNEEECQHSGI